MRDSTQVMKVLQLLRKVVYLSVEHIWVYTIINLSVLFALVWNTTTTLAFRLAVTADWISFLLLSIFATDIFGKILCFGNSRLHVFLNKVFLNKVKFQLVLQKFSIKALIVLSFYDTLLARQLSCIWFDMLLI